MMCLSSQTRSANSSAVRPPRRISASNVHTIVVISLLQRPDHARRFPRLDRDERPGIRGGRVDAESGEVAVLVLQRKPLPLACERFPRRGGFLADVVADWEVATEPAQAGGLRVVAVRTGIVQTPRGGTLQLLHPLFAAGLGGRLGSGRQWLSWIDLDDLLDVYHRALADPAISGPVNAVAPEPVRNEEYTRVLAAVLHRPALLPVPDFGPKLLLGDQGARELAAADQYVVPRTLIDAGHGSAAPPSRPACATSSDTSSSPPDRTPALVVARRARLAGWFARG